MSLPRKHRFSLKGRQPFKKNWKQSTQKYSQTHHSTIIAFSHQIIRAFPSKPEAHQNVGECRATSLRRFQKVNARFFLACIFPILSNLFLKREFLPPASRRGVVGCDILVHIFDLFNFYDFLDFIELGVRKVVLEFFEFCMNRIFLGVTGVTQNYVVFLFSDFAENDVILDFSQILPFSEIFSSKNF